jgi:hypothetical protein
MVQASKGYLRKKQMVGGYRNLFCQSLSCGGEGTNRPNLLRVDDHCGRIMGMISMSDRVMRKLELGLIPVINYQLGWIPGGDSLPNILNPREEQIIDFERKCKILSSYSSAHDHSLGCDSLRGDIIWDHTTICVRHLGYVYGVLCMVCFRQQTIQSDFLMWRSAHFRRYSTSPLCLDLMMV